jgi:hypothetical protein
MSPLMARLLGYVIQRHPSLAVGLISALERP